MAMANDQRRPPVPPVWNPSSAQREVFQEWRMMAIGQLVSFKQGIPPYKLPGRLADTAGENIPFERMGFDPRYRNISYFLYLMASDLEVRKWEECLYVFIRESSVPESMDNIREMVLHQKKGKNEKPLRHHAMLIPSNHLLMRYERAPRPPAPLQSRGSGNARRGRGSRSKNSRPRGGGGPRMLNGAPPRFQPKTKPTPPPAAPRFSIAGPSTSNPKAAPILTAGFRNVFEEYRQAAQQKKIEPQVASASTAPSTMPLGHSVLSQASNSLPVRKSATDVDQKSAFQKMFVDNAKAMQKKYEWRPEPISNTQALMFNKTAELTRVNGCADVDEVDGTTTIKARSRPTTILNNRKIALESRAALANETSHTGQQKAIEQQKHLAFRWRYGYSLDTNMGLDYGRKSVSKSETTTLPQFSTFKLAARFPSYLTTGSKASTSLKAFLEESGQLEEFLKTI